jgi:hypothetical protein
MLAENGLRLLVELAEGHGLKPAGRFQAKVEPADTGEQRQNLVGFAAHSPPHALGIEAGTGETA